ncbi:MAG: hypothetical protein R3F37_20900 [Candidatus Competibacteraceae bacterium]
MTHVPDISQGLAKLTEIGPTATPPSARPRPTGIVAVIAIPGVIQRSSAMGPKRWAAPGQASWC